MLALLVALVLQEEGVPVEVLFRDGLRFRAKDASWEGYLNGFVRVHGRTVFDRPDDDVPPLQATAITLMAATLATTLYVVISRRGLSRAAVRVTTRAFLPAGVLLALAYGALVTGFDRGDVGIVAPLNATQSLWGVAFATLVYGHREAVGRRTVLAGVLVVLGGALIGAFR